MLTLDRMRDELDREEITDIIYQLYVELKKDVGSGAAWLDMIPKEEGSTGDAMVPKVAQ